MEQDQNTDSGAAEETWGTMTPGGDSAYNQDTPDPTFIKLGAGKGLTKRTMQILFDSGYKSKDDLCEIHERQLRDLEIPAAQKFRLRKLCEELLRSRFDEQRPEEAGESQESAETNADQAGDGAAVESDTETDTNPAETGSDGVKEKISLIQKETMLSKMLRPHEAVFGNKTKDHNFLQFIYANLLTLENMYHSDKDTEKIQSVGYLHHLHFITLKMMQQYPVSKVFEYDYLVRNKVEGQELNWKDRSNIGLDDDIVSSLFESDHLNRWKKMRREQQKHTTEAFKIDRCLNFNYIKDKNEAKCEEDCKFEHSCLACGSQEHGIAKCPISREKKHAAPKATAPDARFKKLGYAMAFANKRA